MSLTLPKASNNENPGFQQNSVDMSMRSHEGGLQRKHELEVDIEELHHFAQRPSSYNSSMIKSWDARIPREFSAPKATSMSNFPIDHSIDHLAIPRRSRRKSNTTSDQLKRKERNRVAARDSREKKKNYLHQLEAEVNFSLCLIEKLVEYKTSG